VGGKMNYNDYGKMLERSSRQVGKSTFHLAQLLNWLSFQDHPQDFKPLEFKMELVDVKDI
jgi:hypothetical protein